MTLTSNKTDGHGYFKSAINLNQEHMQIKLITINVPFV